VVVPGKPLQPSLILQGKAGAYPNEEPFGCSTLGKVPGLTSKHYTRLETGTNTLAYYENPQITAVNSFIVKGLVFPFVFSCCRNAKKAVTTLNRKTTDERTLGYHKNGVPSGRRFADFFRPFSTEIISSAEDRPPLSCRVFGEK
jgi:hypothetical protein